MSFKYKVNIWAELNPLSTGHGEEPIVIQNGVEGLDPLRVDITIAYYPGAHICFQNEEVEVK